MEREDYVSTHSDDPPSVHTYIQDEQTFAIHDQDLQAEISDLMDRNSKAATEKKSEEGKLDREAMLMEEFIQAIDHLNEREKRWKSFHTEYLR